MSQEKEKSLFANLWERRLPQFFATYIGICWGIVQFLQFACTRYGLNDNLIEKFLLFAAVLIPAFLLFTYNHGKPGRDSWTKLEKAFIPSNFLIASALAFFFSGTSSVNAESKAVEIINEDGEQITRFVPDASQTRLLAFFPFEDESVENEWAEFAMPYLMCRDLEQDMRVFTRSPGSMEYQINSNNYEITDAIPFSTKLQIASKAKVDYFVTGENLKKEEETWSVDVKMYETSSGELSQEKTYSNPDFYALIDACTKELKSALLLNDRAKELEKVVDLPASDLITPNLEALSIFFKGRKAQYYTDEYAKGAQLFSQAEQMDTHSAELKKSLAFSLSALGDRESAKRFIGEALSLSKQLPERQQFSIKQNYWGLNDQADNVLLLMNNWIKLYPQDYEPHEDLIGFYQQTFQLSKAKDIAQLAIENGHKNRVLPKLIDISIAVEDFDDAEMYLNDYNALYPEFAKEDMRMAEIYLKKGEYDKAIEFYQSLLLDDPQNGKIYSAMAEANMGSGKADACFANLSKAIELSDQAQDLHDIYFKKLMYHASLGESSKFNETFDLMIANAKTYMPEINAGQVAMQLAGMSALCGSRDHVSAFLNDLTAKYPQAKSPIDCVSNFLFTLFGDDPEAFKKYNQGQCKAMVLQGSPDLEYFANGFLKSMEGKHQESIDNFNIFIEKSGAGGKDFGYLLAKEYRKMGQYEEAIKQCETFLDTSPHNGTFLLELALAELAAGKKDKAVETYKRLSNLWKNAEPKFLYYPQYKELGEQLSL